MSNASLIDELPGELLMWVLIISELLVFGAGLIAFMGVRLTDPVGFAEAQSHLYRTGAAFNTAVLVTSGYLAAQALHWRRAAERFKARFALVFAAALGVVFLVIKGAEYAGKAEQGITYETHPFFLFYYLLTGFHAAHVLAGVGLLLLVAWRDDPRNIEAGAHFWHMIDLVWIMLFPVIYQLG
ncbi:MULTISPECIES: cytochrome c oxidase subunit 3 [unclassified Ruegeria]|uniref:cytochrome c oxidase subunit 3 n=1 Tax=unclassified Ruegeria TaxID=2625375 RepID=UPI001490D000|nr:MULTISPECIES: cytochrome c oxidase subunit 3 [unclassified Ruegeria]NOD88433.1 cytochrome c oxidase subunit 3 family protein [Ruegeria sp. HKCCD4318]NOE13342.1 cytochrome c oxidase subunit 3 family protein [Ruegeria sp. HKCCD4318-2]NOG11116.1 cytochrome c oxidase subunit 3 family protein [Ruegeria sp. HKCCD4315]